MRTEEYLGQIERIERLIENKMIEITQLDVMTKGISSVVKEINVQTFGDKDKLGASVVKLVSLQEQYNEQVDELIATKKKIVAQMECLGDTDEYHVLFSRYVAHKSWATIGKEMWYSYKQVDRIHKNAISHFEEQFGADYLSA